MIDGLSAKDVARIIECNDRIYTSGRRYDHKIARMCLECLKDKTIVLFSNYPFEITEGIQEALDNRRLIIFDNMDTIHILKTLSMNPKNDEMAKNEIVIIGIDEEQDATKFVKELHDYEGRIVFVDNNLNRKEDELKEIRMYVDVCL